MSEITLALEHPSLGCGEVIARYDLSEIQKKAYLQGRADAIVEVIKLYEEFQPKLATNVYELGERLRQMQKGGQRMTEQIKNEKKAFAIELKLLVKQKCEEINHYVSGCNSPFSYLQIADVQEHLCGIEDVLGIKGEVYGSK